MNAELLNLPWQVQVSLAGGYAAYLLAYVGIRDAHKTIDTAFISLVFSVIATAVIALVQLPPVATGALAFFAACATALFWRKWGRGALWRLLRQAGISWSNDDPTALATIMSNAKHPVTQISVELDDGTILDCGDTSAFQKAPYGPCIIGNNGDVALYVQQTFRPDGTIIEQDEVSDPHYGDRLTWVPAARVRSIQQRIQTRG